MEDRPIDAITLTNKRDQEKEEGAENAGWRGGAGEGRGGGGRE